MVGRWIFPGTVGPANLFCHVLGFMLSGMLADLEPRTALSLLIPYDLSKRTAPIQIVVCAVLLILQIGPSALVGLALFAALIPLQSKVSMFILSY